MKNIINEKLNESVKVKRQLNNWDQVMDIVKLNKLKKLRNLDNKGKIWFVKAGG